MGIHTAMAAHMSAVAMCRILHQYMVIHQAVSLCKEATASVAAKLGPEILGPQSRAVRLGHNLEVPWASVLLPQHTLAQAAGLLPDWGSPCPAWALR